MQSSTSKLINEIEDRALRIGADRFSVARTIARLHRHIVQHEECFANPIDTAAAAAKTVRLKSLRLPLAAHPEGIR